MIYCRNEKTLAERFLSGSVLVAKMKLGRRLSGEDGCSLAVRRPLYPGITRLRP